jgi:anti-sigma B factor antagonist
MADHTIERNAKECRVRLGEDLTATTVPALQTALKRELSPDVEELTFDLTNTVMLDSTGIGLLIAAYNTMVRGQHHMRVENASTDIMQLLQSMRLVQRLSVTGAANGKENHG